VRYISATPPPLFAGRHCPTPRRNGDPVRGGFFSVPIENVDGGDDTTTAKCHFNPTCDAVGAFGGGEGLFAQ